MSRNHHLRFWGILCLAATLEAGGFVLTSPDISGQLTNDQVFAGFGCEGNNISPELSWANAPAGTKSFAITVYDPDAPTGSGWWHWVVFDIPADVHMLPRNAGNVESHLAPEGVIQSMTSFGQTGFGGACPPVEDGPHAYIITVYALSVDHLGLDAQAPPEMVGFYLHTATLAKASLIAYYDR
ncbi:MAG: YbhB/YbcL family Raf kinase inhibitor-like protein [Candidatus Neomarinimicrobiota bacterium]|nr:MAG: YbhB/YbcL family Raf kinase inhibitor-like protein [Candidatus Neomarinimicrobiota bacterium]